MDRKILNIVLKAMLTVSILTAVPVGLAAQEYVSAPVTVSKEKVKVNGKICYSHIVKEKQTLYSIAKAYNVTVDDIYSFNPSLKEAGLKKNSIILIPAQDDVTAPVAETAVQSEPAQTEPSPVVNAEIKTVEKKGKQKTHTVKWFENIDIIADRYGVSAEAIIKVNNLSSKKLEKRQKLIIPSVDEEAVQDGIAYNDAEQTEGLIENGPAAQEDSVATELMTSVAPKEEVKVTLILPMKASTDNVSRNNMDFYSGVLLAVKDMADSGISTELNVYDSSDETYPIISEDLTDSDLVIGPVSASDLGKLLTLEESQPKMVISPLDSKAENLAYTHKNLIQAPTPTSLQYKDLVNWIREDVMPGDTLLIISEKGARQTEAITQMNEVADSSGLTFIPFSYSILEGRDVTEPLTNLMTATGTNRVLIASDSEAFVNDVVRNLNILIYNKLNVVLYASSRIRNFETIEVENLHNASLHVSLGYLIDYENPQIKDFLLKYRALYNTEPTQYAFQGYDIATYFISMCYKYGSDWTKMLGENERQMLQSTFRYVPAGDGGYINNGIRRLVYGKNWSVNKVR
ncbi:MAG: LysM peptidoglycan-binding domain-containing protein [Bacteroidales bacterium]|nr:LysM peptidoglycan-binding domain-containing protein [Bacteroidales bacterium]